MPILVPRHTAFHPRTSALCVSQMWRRWAGYQVASSYDAIHDREYHAIRNAAALLDVSPLYKYLVTGTDAARLLDRVTTRDIENLKVGRVVYTTWTDGHGKVIDDGTVARLAEDRLRLTSAEPNLRWLSLNAAGLDVTIEDVSDKVAALAVQGPLARDILTRAAEGDVARLKYFGITRAKVAGVDVEVSRTGYTGDLGYEIWIPRELALPVWDRVVGVGNDHGLTPSGILGLDMARVEAGLVLQDVDYISTHRAMIEMQKSSPFELSLGWTVDLAKARFVGRDALALEKERGPAWKLVGLEVDWESLESLFADVGLPPRLPTMAWRTSVPVFSGGEQVGYATSGCWSPLLKKSIALAHVPAQHGATGNRLGIEVTVEHRRRRASAKVVPTPFFDPKRKRETP